MRKENLVEVDKIWGYELWLVNSEKYCAKMLYIKKGAQGSTHYHNNKEETFYCLDGHVSITISGKEYKRHPFSRGLTIEPGELHSIAGLEDSVILEISTHHDDEDTIRLKPSEGAK